MSEIAISYLITFGWALIGSISMAIGIVIALRIFDLSTAKVDEWELIKAGNIPMGMIFSSIILSLGYVIAACVRP